MAEEQETAPEEELAEALAEEQEEDEEEDEEEEAEERDGEDEEGDDEEDEDEEEEEEEESHVPPETLAKWCGKCRGRCCRYYTVYLSEPEDVEDFDELRWFLTHESCYVYIDEGKWHLNVDANCRFLCEDGRCAIYEHRPDVCREFGHEEECEWTGEFDFERTFRTIRGLEAYAKEVLDADEFAELTVFPEDWTGPS